MPVLVPYESVVDISRMKRQITLRNFDELHQQLDEWWHIALLSQRVYAEHTGGDARGAELMEADFLSVEGYELMLTKIRAAMTPVGVETSKTGEPRNKLPGAESSWERQPEGMTKAQFCHALSELASTVLTQAHSKLSATEFAAECVGWLRRLLEHISEVRETMWRSAEPTAASPTKRGVLSATPGSSPAKGAASRGVHTWSPARVGVAAVGLLAVWKAYVTPSEEHCGMVARELAATKMQAINRGHSGRAMVGEIKIEAEAAAREAEAQQQRDLEAAEAAKAAKAEELKAQAEEGAAARAAADAERERKARAKAKAEAEAAARAAEEAAAATKLQAIQKGNLDRAKAREVKVQTEAGEHCWNIQRERSVTKMQARLRGLLERGMVEQMKLDRDINALGGGDGLTDEQRKAMLGMTAAERAAFLAMSDEDRAAYLAMSAAERAAFLASGAEERARLRRLCAERRANALSDAEREALEREDAERAARKAAEAKAAKAAAAKARAEREAAEAARAAAAEAARKAAEAAEAAAKAAKAQADREAKAAAKAARAARESERVAPLWHNHPPVPLMVDVREPSPRQWLSGTYSSPSLSSPASRPRSVGTPPVGLLEAHRRPHSTPHQHAQPHGACGSRTSSRPSARQARALHSLNLRAGAPRTNVTSWPKPGGQASPGRAGTAPPMSRRGGVLGMLPQSSRVAAGQLPRTRPPSRSFIFADQVERARPTSQPASVGGTDGPRARAFEGGGPELGQAWASAHASTIASIRASLLATPASRATRTPLGARHEPAAALLSNADTSDAEPSHPTGTGGEAATSAPDLSLHHSMLGHLPFEQLSEFELAAFQEWWAQCGLTSSSSLGVADGMPAALQAMMSAGLERGRAASLPRLIPRLEPRQGGGWGVGVTPVVLGSSLRSSRAPQSLAQSRAQSSTQSLAQSRAQSRPVTTASGYVPPTSTFDVPSSLDSLDGMGLAAHEIADLTAAAGPEEPEEPESRGHTPLAFNRSDKHLLAINLPARDAAEPLDGLEGRGHTANVQAPPVPSPRPSARPHANRPKARRPLEYRLGADMKQQSPTPAISHGGGPRGPGVPQPWLLKPGWHNEARVSQQQVNAHSWHNNASWHRQILSAPDAELDESIPPSPVVSARPPTRETLDEIMSPHGAVSPAEDAPAALGCGGPFSRETLDLV